MKFDDCIYKEITWFNADEIVEHETFDGIDSYELLRNLATLEAGYSLDDRLDDEAVERVEDEENSLICVGRFRFDSLLAEGLAEWFKCDRYDGLVKHVRSCWLSRGGDDWYFYFVTGCGYDVISSDLLAVTPMVWRGGSSLISLTARRWRDDRRQLAAA